MVTDKPVTDAEVEAAIDALILSVRDDGINGQEDASDEARLCLSTLRSLIARRVAEERVHDAAELRAENARLRLEIGLLESRVPSEPVTDAGSAVVEELLASLGLHPDTDLETVRSHIDSVRAEARCSADARQMGRDEERARAQALADAVDTHIRELVKHWQPAPFMDGSRRVPPSIERRLQWLENALAAWKSGGAK